MFLDIRMSIRVCGLHLVFYHGPFWKLCAHSSSLGVKHRDGPGGDSTSSPLGVLAQGKMSQGLGNAHRHMLTQQGQA